MFKTLRYRQGHGGYVSDFTKFMEEFLDQHPEVRESRRRGWRIYWERPADLREMERTMADRVPEPPYHYD